MGAQAPWNRVGPEILRRSGAGGRRGLHYPAGLSNMSTTSEQTLFDASEITISMGPQHPSTHGVLQVKLKLDGERVSDVQCVIGYLHRGVEKLGEVQTYG